MHLNLEGKSLADFGLRGSGKSNFAAVIAELYGPLCLVYDTLGEYSDNCGYDRYVPNDRGSVAEFEKVCRAVLRSRKYRLFIIDEAHRFCPPKPAPLPPAARDLNDFCRHAQYNIGVIWIAQRPVKLNQDITEQADYLALFRLSGKNDQSYLNDIADGLGDAVKALPDYHFILADQSRAFKIQAPVAKAKKSNR